MQVYLSAVAGDVEALLLRSQPHTLFSCLSVLKYLALSPMPLQNQLMSMACFGGFSFILHSRIFYLFLHRSFAKERGIFQPFKLNISRTHFIRFSIISNAFRIRRKTLPFMMYLKSRSYQCGRNFPPPTNI